MNGMNSGKPQHVMMVAILSQACGVPQELNKGLCGDSVVLLLYDGKIK